MVSWHLVLNAGCALIFTNCLSAGGEEQLESNMETLSNSPAVPLRRRHGQTHKSTQNSFSQFFFAAITCAPGM